MDSYTVSVSTSSETPVKLKEHTEISRGQKYVRFINRNNANNTNHNYT